MYWPREQDDEPSEERMDKHTKRRKRRRANSVIRFGKNSVRAHKRKTGRTGGIQSKKNHPKRATYVRTKPNPPGPHNMDLGL
jgi:hypothetical protein